MLQVKTERKICIVVLVFIAVISIHNVRAGWNVLAQEEDATQKTLGQYYNDLESFTDIVGYSDYLLQYKNEALPAREYAIEADSYTKSEGMTVETLHGCNGMEGASVFTGDQGLIEYEVAIEEAGLYNISFLYYPVEGKSSAIQRSIFIDGKLPFSEVSNVEFDRIWINKDTINAVDNQGNNLRPSQIEAPAWVECAVEDYQGYYTAPYRFYFTKGKHKLTVISRREPMVLRQIRIYHGEEPLPYAQKLAEYKAKGCKEVKNRLVIVEAEDAVLKSSQMLYPVIDHSSPAVTPYSPKVYLNNSIGGNNWRIAGQWLEWEIEAPESGLYKIGFNAKQNFVRGIYTSRKLYIDGKVPFAEMDDIPFRYESDWRIDVLGGEKTPYLFYLGEGKHRLRMEVVLGELSTVIREVETGLKNINEIYRKILEITGVSPDKYRDYQLEASIPGIVDAIEKERDRLDKVLADLKSTAGNISDREAGLITMRDQLDNLSRDVEDVTRQMTQFKINIGSIGDWMTQAVNQPLQLDEIYLMAPSTEVPKLKNSFADKFIHEIKTLFYSFIIDYSAIGNVAQKTDRKGITVWVGTGRDQANTMKLLIDEDFTKNSGVNVNLMLVDMNTLLPATLSGEGPDVAIQVTNDLPMNYGMRNAVADLSGFKSFNDVRRQFYESAMLPYEFEGRCFALPEQQTFSMLFYRRDILKELGLQPPKTWKDVKADISVLNKKQMAFGMLPSQYYNPNAAGMLPISEAVFGIFLYQNGGSFYNKDATRSGLDTDASINAFKQFTEYYTDYKLDKEFDAVSRFRTGEMPMIIADYTTYNTLQVSAPEIKGLWGFSTVPGTVQKDGTVKKDVPSSGTACIMMNGSRNKESAWEFMKWWVSANIQTRFGREMEGLMGPSARYPTANIKAFANLPWPVEDYNALSEQFKVVRGVPQVPGGYFTSRHLNNAYYNVVNNSVTIFNISINKGIEPREALTDYVRYINEEIKYKRKEFGLSD